MPEPLDTFVPKNETQKWMKATYQRYRREGRTHEEAMAAINDEIEAVDYVALARELQGKS